MKFTLKSMIYLMFSLFLILLGIRNFAETGGSGFESIAISALLIFIGLTLSVTMFIPSWLKAVIFVEGLLFVIIGFFLSVPYLYVFILFGVILLVIAILAYLMKLPPKLLNLFYKN